jgi:hypothetical protein
MSTKESVTPADARQYRRSVMAMRVYAAMGTKLGAKNCVRIEQLRETLFPPQTLSDAAGLATAGNTVLKFVSYHAHFTASQRARCIRTLRLIGTPEAQKCLLAYASEHTLEVIEELVQAIDPFRIPAVLECFTETAETLAVKPIRSKDDDVWRRTVRSAARTQIHSCAALAGRHDLVELDLSDTRIVEADLKELARPDFGLTALTALYLCRTPVQDLGLRELARPDTGLKALTTLDLSSTGVTDAGVQELAHPDTGLKALTTLNVSELPLTFASVKALARPDTGLKALETLFLTGTPVTNAGLKEIARVDTGLKVLGTLFLRGHLVTDLGLKELARPDSGLKALKTLYLYGMKVSDAGLRELARPDAGLNALTTLCLYDTLETHAGIKALKDARPALRIET